MGVTGLYWDILGYYWDNGKENGNYDLGFRILYRYIHIYIYIHTVQGVYMYTDVHG